MSISTEVPHEHYDPNDPHHSHGGVGKYLMVFGALLVLTFISFAVANYEPIMSTPSVGWAIMMAVSCAKALLVISFFMHLIWEANWKYVLTIPASIMSLFLVLMLVPDIGMRTHWYSEERLMWAAPPAPQPLPHGKSDTVHHEGAKLPYTVEQLEAQNAEHDPTKDEH